MSQSGKFMAGISRGLSVALCSATLLFVMEAPAQAQSALTHHVRQEVISGQAQFLSPLPATQSLRLDIVLPLRDQAGLDQFLQDSTILPALPTGTSLRCRSSPRGLVPARKIMTP